MAGSQVTIVANQIEKQRLGYQAISLTNYDNNLEPQIAAGSKVEIGNALFEFTALESITGWGGIAINNDVYIKLTVAGASVTASFTTVAPTWDTAKQGWYSGSERYIGGLRKDAGANYTLKWLYGGQNFRAATANLRDAAVTTAKIADANVTGNKISSALGAWGSHAMGPGGNWLVPAGIHVFASNMNIGVQVSDGLGGWLGVATNLGGAVISDGVNVRLLDNGTSATANYRKLL